MKIIYLLYEQQGEEADNAKRAGLRQFIIILERHYEF
jgi:hypothetical protein